MMNETPTNSGVQVPHEAGASSALMSILADLIGFDTTSRNSNLELIRYVEDYLSQHGVQSTLVHDDSGHKANLYATIGPAELGGVMLSGHTDVVPVDGQRWASDPFVLERIDDKVFGRGSADMKGFIACVLEWVPEMVAASLTTPIHIALSYDEEVGCIGVRRLLDLMEKMPVVPSMAIIGEPTNMEIVVAHKGKRGIRVNVRGASAHSAYPTEGVKAIEVVAQLIAHISEVQQDIEKNGPFDPGYRVPHTTLHVGTVRGGTALNIVPNECSFDFEIRHLPEHEIDPLIDTVQRYARDNLEPTMRLKNPDCGIDFTELFGYPALFTAPDAPVVAFVRSLLECDRAVEQISFGSEAGLFSRRIGIPAVVCGPGSILQAHRPDEYVSIEQLETCRTMLRRLVESLSRNGD
jgi:acetylornithine deacetylase